MTVTEQVPQQAAVTPVDLTKPTPDDPAQPDAAQAPRARQRAVARMRRGTSALWTWTSQWAGAADLTDEDAEKLALVHRSRQASAARRQYAHQLRSVRNELRAVRAEEGSASPTVAQLEDRLQVLQEAGPDIRDDESAPITGADIARARFTRRVSRCAIVAAAAGSAVYLPVLHPGLALLELPGAGLALWLAGRETAADDESAAPAADAPAPVGIADMPTPPAPMPVEVVTVAEPTPPPSDQAVWVSDALKENDIPFGRILTVANLPWGCMVDVEMPGKGAKLLAERLTDVNSSLRRRKGATSFQVNPKDTGIVTLRIVNSDPFNGLGASAHHKPLSLSVNRQLPMGCELDGSPFSIGFARTHGALVGGSGSGKSSAIWTAIDGLSACDDVVLMGIDLTGAPALNAWGDVLQELATEPEDAEDLLKRLLQMGRGRCAILGERSRPRLGQPLPDLKDENWVPSPDGPQIVLIVDEYPTLVEAGLWPYVATLLKVTRKAAITVLLASQRATQAELGSTTVKAQLGLRCLMACDSQDVQQLLGPGMRAQGWTPDVLQPALGKEPFDAGVVYAYGGQHIAPNPKKWYRLSLTDVHKRALERMAAGLPQVDEVTLGFADDHEDVKVDVDALEVDEEPAGTPLTPAQVQLLEDVVGALDGAPRGHCRTLAATLDDINSARYGGWDAARLRTALEAAGVDVKPSVKVDGAVTTGVHLDAIVHRLNSAPEPADTPPTDPPTD